MAYQKTRAILHGRRLAPAKSRGQNFLVNAHTAQRIVDHAALGPEDSVVEVGVGLGALTRVLAGRARLVIGLEVDSGLVRYLLEEAGLPDNVELRHMDVLKADFAELAEACGGRVRLVANLPYAISSPFLFKVLEHRDLVDWAVVMLQKEVALRLCAAPGTKDYGALTVLVAATAEARPLFTVGPGEFHPRPKVDSMVARLDLNPVPARVAALPAFDRDLFRRLVAAAFGQRRKTLVNGLSASGILEKERFAELIAVMGLRPDLRAERLDLEDFVALTRLVEAILPPV